MKAGFFSFSALLLIQLAHNCRGQDTSADSGDYSDKNSPGFYQELFLHESEHGTGNYFYFRDAVPDLSLYPLQNVKLICARGLWVVYTNPNYTTEYRRWYGNYDGLSFFCRSVPSPFPYRSFRHEAASFSRHPALSLYAGDYYDKEEFFTTADQVPEIPLPIVQTLALSGRTSWTLYEGKNFTGKSVCAPGANGQGHFQDWAITVHGLKNVQSVIKGCQAGDKVNNSSP